MRETFVECRPPEQPYIDSDVCPVLAQLVSQSYERAISNNPKWIGRNAQSSFKYPDDQSLTNRANKN